ncbi:MAG TPA: phenylalanine--tRNA ligase subunit beta [Gaiellaceae bacterium]|jgi:phenylalanyl-tRNA synthetase beta chain|nr:phenylalanine--tRNA ligase subunit beta [Gaiellaceae bacterium]
MRVPVSWLREYVRVDATADGIAHALSISTGEVNEVVHRGVSQEDGNLDRFRVGLVLEAAKHPNADRLQLCRVDVGQKEPYQIVCGAWNFGPGAKVAVALPGATLPNGLTLERRELRGQVSEGMILAEDEVDLGTDHQGIMVLDDDLEPGTPLADVLPLVEQVLDVEPTGNRPDLLSVYGIAREVAALLEGELSPLPGVEPAGDGSEGVDVRIEDFVGCPRYVGRLFRDVAIADSPVWLKARLRAAGVRAISNVVDVTNYVMLALGSPLHVFDFDALHGGCVIVRRARKGEELRTLDGTLRRLDPADLLIADADRAVALAGIMGGEETEVSERTTSVLLEAANFEPVGILRSSERLALRTEGSNRWEKGVDPHVAGPAATLATQLIVELSGARWTGHTDVQGTLPERALVRLRPERTDALLGLEVPALEQAAILGRLGFEAEGDGFRVPTWRARDVAREIDLIEEVARFKMSEIPFTLPRRDAMFGRLTGWQRLRRVVEDVLAGCGFSEAYTPTFVADGELRLPEPLSTEAAALRTALAPSLVEAARHNVSVGNSEIALFEVARVYRSRENDLPEERWHVAGIVEGGLADAKWAVEQLYGALKIEPAYERAAEPPLHPGKSARTAEGWVGELHPSLLDGAWGGFELDLDALVAAAPEAVEFEEVSPFPEVRQDLAFVVDEDVPAAALASLMRKAAGSELRSLSVFDEYRGEQIGAGKRSLAFRVAFGSPERTLTDEEAAVLRGRIVDALAQQFGAVLRA